MPEKPAPASWSPDPSQRAVLELPVTRSALVVGAAGSGKTATLVEFVARRILDEQLAPEQVLVLAAARAQADALREQLAARIPVVTTGPWARTAASVAFEAVAERARTEGAAPPRLLSGAEHDLAIRDVLDGHVADGTGPDWPAHLDATVRSLPGFRTELRELMMRATEYDVTPAALTRLGELHGRPAWIAAGAFMAEYSEVVAQSHPGLLDPAELTVFAAHALRDGLAGGRLAGVRLVVVDDVQQASEGTVRLVRAFADAGATVVGFGDPDLAADTFKGAGAQTVARFRATALPADALELTLDRVHRHGPALRAVVAEVSHMIGTAGIVGHRSAESAAAVADPETDAASGADHEPPLAPAAIVEQPSAWTLAASIGRELRERHLLDGVPWGQLAVIVRSRGDIAALERQLASAQVPTRSSAVGRPLRDHPEAAALLRVVEVGTGRRVLDGDTGAHLLLGPFGGFDPVGLRRLRLALRSEALTAGDSRSSAELLAEALGAAAGFATIDSMVGRHAARMAKVLARVTARFAAGASAEELLWEAWEGSGVAEGWRRAALGTGITADEALRALDGVVALFAAARRFAESRPTASATDFLDELLDADVPADVITPQGAAESVLLTTPTGAVGFEFDTVIVAGLQDGRWPDLRVRGTLLGGPALVDVVTGLDPETLDARREVLGDELRLLAVAASRARRRLVLAVVDADDEVPSPVVGVLRRLIPTEQIPASAFTVRGAIGRLRHTLTAEGVSDRRRADAAAALALLADAEVPGADPNDWRGLSEVSTDRPLVDLDDPEHPDATVRVSPSKLETFERSPMEWFVESHQGGSSGAAAGFGTLIHDVFEHAVEPEQQTVEAMSAALDERWGELQFESAWVGRQQRRAAQAALEALAAYLATQNAAGAVRLAAEKSFEMEEAPARLTGTIDRIEQHGDSVVIIDLKTGRPRTQGEVDANPQLKAYQLAFAQGQIGGIPEGVTAGGARMLYTRAGGKGAPYKIVDQTPLNDEQLREFAQFVSAAARTMAGATFPATPIDDPFALAGADTRLVHLPGEVSGD